MEVAWFALMTSHFLSSMFAILNDEREKRREGVCWRGNGRWGDWRVEEIERIEPSLWGGEVWVEERDVAFDIKP